MPKSRIRPRLLTNVFVGVLVTGCMDPIAPGEQREPLDSVVWQIRLSPRGITMAVGQTVPLQTSILNMLGDSMVVNDSMIIEYRSLDTSRVRITPHRTIEALKATTVLPTIGQVEPVGIIGTVRYGKIVGADTIFVAVTDTAPTHPPTTLSLVPVHPYPQDSTWGAYIIKTIPVTVTTSSGDTVPNPFVYLHTEQWTKGLVEQLTPKTRNMLFLRNPGKFWIYATGVVYGVEFRDSVEYVNIDLQFGNITLNQNPSDPNTIVPLVYADGTMYVSPCASIAVTNLFPDPIDLIFDEPSATVACTPGDETGNILALAPNASVVRKIKVSGVYGWRVVRTDGRPFTKPFTGKVRVRSHDEF